MVYAFPVVRVTISGTAATGAEEWSTGFFVGAESAGASNPTQQFADAIKSAWQTFFTSATTGVSNTVTSNQVKLSQLGTDGKTIPEDTIFSTWATPINGTLTTTLFPPQITLAATLASSLPRGLGAKGRMYLPGICHPLISGGIISTTNQTNIGTNLATFFNAVNTAAPVGSRVILASEGHKKTNTGALNKNVTSVKVGNVYDTQRRRRNGIRETYTTANLA